MPFITRNACTYKPVNPWERRIDRFICRALHMAAHCIWMREARFWQGVRLPPPPMAAVDQPVGHGGDQHRRGDVQDGVLLQEHRGDGDENSREGEGRPPQRGGEPGGVPGGGQDGQGSDDVERRAHVGIGVKVVEPAHEPGEHIVPQKGLRPQLLLGWVDHIDEAGDGIGQDNKPHVLPKALGVKEGQVEEHTDEEHKPEEVWQQKGLAEGDEVIQGAVHGLEITAILFCFAI